MTAAQVLTLIQTIHNAENWNLGTGSTRGYRNYFFARAIGCVHFGHPIYNATPDTSWLLKKTSSGAPQSDDTTANTDTHFWDMIVGSGANGYTFSATDLGPIVDQFPYAPPVPSQGVIDGGTFAAGDFKYKVGHFTKAITNTNQVIPSIVDECGDIDSIKCIIFWGTLAIGTMGEGENVKYFFGATDSVLTSEHQFGYCLNVDASLNTSFWWHSWSNSVFFFTNPQGVAKDNIGAVTSLTADSFTVNYQVNDGVPAEINYLVLGGEDMHVVVKPFGNPSGVPFPHQEVYPVSGIGQITGMILVPMLSGSGNSNFPNNMPALGFAMEDGDGVHQYSSAVGFFPSFNSGLQRAYRSQRTDLGLIQLSNNPASATASEAEVVDLGIDEFTLNWLKAWGGTPSIARFYAICIAGPQMMAGSTIQPTSLGDQDVALPFDPGAVLVLSTGQTASTGVLQKAKWSIGAMDGLEQNHTWFSVDGTSQRSQTIYADDLIFTNATANSVLPVSILSQAAGELHHNKFTFDWTDVTDLSQTQLLWLAFQAGIFFEDECDGSETLTIACPLIDSAVINVAYSDSLEATGGTLPYTFAIATGTLPTGLSLNASTGAITGTPTVADDFTFQATVTDAEDRVVSIECTITISSTGCQLLSSNNNIILSTDGTSIFASTDCSGTPVQPFSGIYKLVPGKNNDTVFGPSGQSDDIINIAIPTPFFETAYFGNK